MRTIFVVIGSHAEAIRMVPVVRGLQAVPALQAIVCLATRHRQLPGQALDSFNIRVDEDLALTRLNPGELHGEALRGISRMLEKHRPDCLLVQGGTTEALAAGMAAFYRHIPVAHMGAGVRTHDLHHPWPEEVSNRVLDLVSTHHLVPDESCRANLLGEGVAAEGICVTGDAMVDALRMVDERIHSDAALKAELAAMFPVLERNRRLILVVTGHQHENQCSRLEGMFRALKRLAMRPDVQVVCPVQPGSEVRRVADEASAHQSDIWFIEPPAYLPFAYLMRKAHLILTDAAGIQAEAPSLGRPVLVTRDASERPEGIDAGTIKLVGTDSERILQECAMFLDDDSYYRAYSGRQAFLGDEQASQRIVAALLR